MEDYKEGFYAKEDDQDPLYLTDIMERSNPNFTLRMDTRMGVFEGCHRVIPASHVSGDPDILYDSIDLRTVEENEDIGSIDLM